MGGVGTHAESVISGLGEGKDQTLVLMVDTSLKKSSWGDLKVGKEVRKKQNRRRSHSSY